MWERDQVFGAGWDAYSCKWMGSSYMNPEYSEEELYRAMRWALEETGGDAPVCTVAVGLEKVL